jgi:hypothetical protein
MGLLEREHSRAPYKHVIPLEDAGLEVPEISKLDGDTEDTEESVESTEIETGEDLVEEPELIDYE